MHDGIGGLVQQNKVLKITLGFYMKKYLFIGLMVCSISGYADTNTANHQTSNTNDNNLLVQLVDTKLANMEDKLERVEKSNQDSITEVRSRVDDKGIYVGWWLNALAIWLTALGIFAPIGGYILNRRIDKNIKDSTHLIEQETQKLQTEINQKLQEANQELNKIRGVHKEAKNMYSDILKIAKDSDNKIISPEDKKKVLDSAEDIQRQLTPEEWFVMGYNVQQNQQYYDAITYYGQSIKLSDSDKLKSLAYNNRGSAKDDLGKYEEAILDYDEAIKLNQLDGDYYSNLGNAKTKLGKYAEAILDHDKAIKLNPQKADYYNNRGNTKAKLDNHEEAIQDYDEAIKLNPQSIHAHFNKACAYALLKKKQLALQGLDDALKLGYDVDKVLSDSDWSEYLNDTEFNAIINKYKKNNHAKQD